jgi:hypothetical protein
MNAIRTLALLEVLNFSNTGLNNDGLRNLLFPKLSFSILPGIFVPVFFIQEKPIFLRLKSLDISGTEITDDGLQKGVSVISTTDLTIYTGDTKITSAGINRLIALLNMHQKAIPIDKTVLVEKMVNVNKVQRALSWLPFNKVIETTVPIHVEEKVKVYQPLTYNIKIIPKSSSK